MIPSDEEFVPEFAEKYSQADVDSECADDDAEADDEEDLSEDDAIEG